MQDNTENMLQQTVLNHIKEADMILVGLGEEFDVSPAVKNSDTYKAMRNKLEEAGAQWLIPACQRALSLDWEESVHQGLTNLCNALREKNYFVVATTTNELVWEIPWKEKRMVAPCGGMRLKQCSEACEGTVQELAKQDLEAIGHYMNTKGNPENVRECALGYCPNCGKAMILNNIYADNYDESSYLEQWEIYLQWMQGTLNKRLLILELGVGMEYPSVIRWPFEKIAFYNKKAEFFRINKRLYHLTEELSQKGTAIAENAIDWLQMLC